MALALHLPLLSSSKDYTNDTAKHGFASIENTSSVTMYNSGGPIAGYMHLNSGAALTYNSNFPIDCSNICLSYWIRHNYTSTTSIVIVALPVNIGGFGAPVGTLQISISSAKVPVNTWTHIAMNVIHKPETATFYLEYYINGVYDSSKEADVTWTEFRFGHKYGKIKIGCEYAYDLADLRIYDNALSKYDIVELQKKELLHYSFESLPPYNEFVLGKAVSTNSNAVKNTYLNGFNVDMTFWYTTINPNITWKAGCTYTCYFSVSNANTSDGGIIESEIIIYYDDGSHVGSTKVEVARTAETQHYSIQITPKAGNVSSTELRLIRKNNNTSRVIANVFDIVICKGETADVYNGTQGIHYIHDESGNNCDAEIIEAIGLSKKAAIGTRSLCINGNGYAALPVEAKLTNRLTANVWAYMDTWANSEFRILSSTQSGGWSIACEASSSYKILFQCYDSGVGYKPALANKTFADLSSGWHMFTLVFDGSKVSGYLDGEFVAVSSTYSSGKISYNASNRILLGAEAAGTATGCDTGIPFFPGLIDDLKIYATALSAGDIKNLYTNKCTIGNNYDLHTGKLDETSISRNAESNISDVTTYNYIGSEQAVTLQPGTYFIECWGADGGAGLADGINVPASQGGYSCGTIQLDANTEFYLNIGGKGTIAANSDSFVQGGYNGGGSTYGASQNNNLYLAGSGGGATHIATQSGVLSSLELNKSAVKIVAGGAGGATFGTTFGSQGNGGLAGSGGGTTGGDAAEAPGISTKIAATGGTQTSGGIAGGNTNYTFGENGSFGQGGLYNGNADCGGGGGGGWYGGGSAAWMGGGGGSGYIGGVTDGITAQPSETGYVDNPDTSGNGYIRITYTQKVANIAETITTKSIINSDSFTENYYMNLEDGAVFLKIFSHNVSECDEYFTSADEAKFCLNKTNRFSRLKDIPSFISNDGKYEFVIRYPDEEIYEVLDYIESDGNAYIGTGWSMPSDGMVDCLFYKVDTMNNYLYGTKQNSASMIHNGLYGAGALEYNYETINYTSSQYISQTQRISGNTMTIQLNNATTTKTVGADTTGGLLYIFACQFNNGDIRPYGGRLRCYSFKLTSASSGVCCDFIPVRRKSDGAVGLFDKVYSSFHSNWGSGSFTPGQKIGSIKAPLYNRWIQTKNPFNTNDTSETAESMGYSAVHLDWTDNWYYGLGISSGGALFDAEQGHSHWWQSIGQYDSYEGGFPGPANRISKNVELFIRVDNTNYKQHASIHKNYINADEFNEW